MIRIGSFHGEYRFLSNFWPAVVRLEGQKFPTVEHAYVAAKTLDLDKRTEIAAVSSPGKVKRLGRKLELRSDWGDVKLPVMEGLLRQKFSIPELSVRLLETGDAELVEGNTWGDTFWGVCDGVGQNRLGHLLMRIRSELCKQLHA